MEYIKTQNLAAGYGHTVIVDGIEIEVKEGQIVTLIGPNGAGKSTILKTMAGLLEPLDGHVYLQGQEMSALAPETRARQLAVAMASEGVRERITCFDAVALGRYPYTGLLGRLSTDDIRLINESMEATAVADLADRDFTEISDGQRQRVLLARALCQEPQVLILDEPTTFLDVRYRLEFLSLLLKVTREKNIAVILSLHELDMAQQISDIIVCVKEGHVVKSGSPAEIFVPGYINELFDIRLGYYDEAGGRAVLWQRQ